MSELNNAILGLAEDASKEDDAGDAFGYPPEGEQEKSVESEETLSEDEKSG
jgi:hypothetical protein